MYSSAPVYAVLPTGITVIGNLGGYNITQCIYMYMYGKVVIPQYMNMYFTSFGQVFIQNKPSFFLISDVVRIMKLILLI